jgi:hypothetical protein
MITFRMLIDLPNARRASEPEFRTLKRILDELAVISDVDDRVNVWLSEPPDGGDLLAVLRRTKPTMGFSDWSFSHEPTTGPEGEYVYRKRFTDETPTDVMNSIRAMLQAPLSGPDET